MPFSAFFGRISLVNADSQQDTDNGNAAPVYSINIANEGTDVAEGGAGVAEECAGVEGGAGVAEECAGAEGGAGVAEECAGAEGGDGVAEECAGTEGGTGVAEECAGAEGGAGVAEECAGAEGGAGVAPLGVLLTGLPVLPGGVANDGITGVEEDNGGVEEDNGGVEEDNGGVEDEDSYDESVGCSSKQSYPKKSYRSSLQKDFPDVSVMLHFVDTMFVVCLFF